MSLTYLISNFGFYLVLSDAGVSFSLN